MGFNLIRIHLIDCDYAPNGILDPAFKGQLRLDAGRIDKLDYFIAQLKRNGLYVELPINGQHWRNVAGPTAYEGVETAKFASFSSGVPLWNAGFIAGEKQWARDFFGHVNPYTGHAYTEEPCVATMEIVNENGIICGWRGGHPQGLAAGHDRRSANALECLPEETLCDHGPASPGVGRRGNPPLKRPRCWGRCGACKW